MKRPKQRMNWGTLLSSHHCSYSIILFYQQAHPIFFLPFATAKKPFDIVAFSLTASPGLFYALAFWIFLLQILATCCCISWMIILIFHFLYMFFSNLSFIKNSLCIHSFQCCPHFFFLIGKICNCISSILILEISNPPMFFLICHTPLLNSYLLAKWAHSQRS